MKKLFIFFIFVILSNMFVYAQSGWTTQTSGTASYLFSVYFTNANTGYAVGSDGIIFKTTDAGVNWTVLTIGIYNWLNSVYFPVDNIGYSAGHNGTILKTSNAGIDWTEQTSGTINNLNSVYFTDVNTGYAVGDTGLILKTSNAGISWTVQLDGVANYLSSIYFTDANNAIRSITMQSDGKTIIGGDFTSFNGMSFNRLARLNANGSLDVSFNPGTGANNIVRSTTQQSDGKIIIGGVFTSFNGMSLNRLARLNVNGSLDTTFNIGSGANSNILTVSLQSDGKIIIGGVFTNYNNTSRNYLARLNLNGSLDISFNSGQGFNNSVYTATLQSSGEIIIGGSFSSYNEFAVSRITRLNIDGSYDLTFNLGTGANARVLTAIQQSDEKIIILGWFTGYNGLVRKYLARLNTDGSLDNSFNTGAGANNNISTSVLQSNGKIIIGGSFTSFNGIVWKYLARLNEDGSLDTTFNTGTGPNNNITAIALQSDGKIIISGFFTSYDGTDCNQIARLNEDGSYDVSFNSGTGLNDYINTIALQSDGKIIISGFFTSYNGVVRNRIARLNANGSLDTTFDPGTGANNFITTSILQSDGKIIIGGNFTSYNGVVRNRIARMHVDGSLDVTFDPGTGANYSIYNTTLQNNGKIIIGGSFTNYNGTDRNQIARLNEDGSLDATFDPGTGVNGYVNNTTLQSDGKIIICGEFTNYNGIGRNRIARLQNTVTDISSCFNSSEIPFVFPNPASEVLQIKFNDNAIIHIIDITGRVLIVQSHSSELSQLDVSTLTNGVYIVKIVSEKNTVTSKIVVKN